MKGILSPFRQIVDYLICLSLAREKFPRNIIAGINVNGCYNNYSWYRRLAGQAIMTECAITLLCQSANNGSLAKIIPSPGYRDVWQTHYVRYQIMWHLHKYFWDEDNWILWGELFMSQIIIPVFRRPGFPHSADVTFSTTNTDPYSTRWLWKH